MDTTMQDAVRFISDVLREDPKTDLSTLIEEASRKFDLNPLQAEFLLNKYIIGK